MVLAHTYFLSTKSVFAFAAQNLNSTRVRRNQRCHCSLQLGSRKYKDRSKKIFKRISRNILTSIFIFFVFASSSHAQLTYEHLAVQYDSPWVCGKLKLIPVRFKGGGAPANFLSGGLISLEEAFKEGKVSLKETSNPGGSDVNLLEIKNLSKKNILVNSGEMLAGGKQDRAVGSTTIIAPNEKNYLSVFCIEKGRWDGKPRSFHYSGSAGGALRKQIDISKKQNKVWKEIDDQLHDAGLRNKTWEYLDLFKDSSSIDTACLHFLRRKLRESDSAYAGFVAVTGNRIIACDLFGSNDLCIASFEVILKGYERSITLNDDVPQVSNDEVKAFLDKFLKTEEQQKEFLATHGSLYTYQNHVIHLVAYP